MQTLQKFVGTRKEARRKKEIEANEEKEITKIRKRNNQNNMCSGKLRCKRGPAIVNNWKESFCYVIKDYDSCTIIKHSLFNVLPIFC